MAETRLLSIYSKTFFGAICVNLETVGYLWTLYLAFELKGESIKISLNLPSISFKQIAIAIRFGMLLTLRV